MVFRGALVNCAVAIIFAHNHPSGECEPSPEDYVLTKVLVDSGDLLGIKVLDHLVVGAEHHVSIRERRPELFPNVNL
jgi:DNA repair protein RadC